MYIKTFDEMKRTTAFFMLKPAKAIYGFIITVAVAIFAVIIWACAAPMDDVIKASVLLRPAQTVSSIKCVASGELAVKNFENDDIIETGALLFSLDTAVYQKELDICQKELQKTEKDILVVENLLKTIATGTLPENVTNTENLVKAQAYLTEKRRYETSILDIKTKLEREQEKPESLKIPQNIQDLQTQLSQNELTLEAWKNEEQLNAMEQKKQLQSAKNNTESRMTELERTIRNSTIYAPISGRITEVTKLNKGDYILAGEEVLKIVPQNSESLKADIYVDPSYIARIQVGNAVKIKFPGLPPSRYGQVETEVSIVPPDVTVNASGQPVFIVEAEIESPYLYTKSGKQAKLLPGISAEARIITDKCTVMEMLLRKLDFIN